MTAPYAGGHQLLRAVWTGPRALRVTFSSTYGTTYHYQVYAGRTLAGVTKAPSERSIIAQVPPSLYPQPLQLLAVTAGNRNTDYGSPLPLRPYNKARLRFASSAWTDAKYIDVTRGSTAGGAVSSANLVRRILFDTNRTYEVVTDPLPGSGTWNFEIVGKDAVGNVGTELEQSVTVVAMPPDVTLNSSGNRLTVSVASQTATIGYTRPA